MLAIWDFGTWEQIFYGEFDGDRPKRVLVKIIGEYPAWVTASIEEIGSMKPASLQQALSQVISEMLARNRSYFGAGGPGYYGIEVGNLSFDGSEFDLTLTFISGVRYCCIEHGCHIPLYSSDQSCAGWFNMVRAGLKMAGIEDDLPPMTVRSLHVIVEEGAINDGSHGNLYSHKSRLEYDEGPFHEVGQTRERINS